MSQPIDPYYNAHITGQLQTPIKELPPSLGFGSSSSPAFESPASISHTNQFFQWSPQHNQPKCGPSNMYFRSTTSKTSPFQQLLPSQFPPAGYLNLGSSPPDAHRPTIDKASLYSRANTGPGLDLGASPKSGSQKCRKSPKKNTNGKTGQRGRPRKYILEEMQSNSQNLMKSSSNVGQGEFPTPSQYKDTLKRKRSIYEDEPKRLDKSNNTAAISSKISVYIDRPTTNGVPLFSAKAFELACEHQSSSSRNSDIGKIFPEYENMRTQFSTNGLGFNFSINMNGQVTMDTTQLTPISPSSQRLTNILPPKSLTKQTPAIIKCLFEEDSNSEYEAESDTTISPVRTPPRFSSLGHCDAATAFAKSLARTSDRGLAFLFPYESTPDKHAHLSSFKPCTPRTPRVPLKFDESLLSMQMKTPPGAIFSSYEHPIGNFATGMTPYMSSARSLELS